MEAYVQPPKGDIKTWMKLNLGLKYVEQKNETPVNLEYFYIPGMDQDKKKLRFKDFFEKVESIVCSHLEVDCNDLAINHKCRKEEYVFARYLIWALMKKHTNKSLKFLGIRYLKDHATVLHGLKSVQNRIQTEPKIRELYSLIDFKVSKYELLIIEN